MKWVIVLFSLILATSAFAQTPEVVMTNADVGIRFSGETKWINGGDMTQEIFSVGTISYSPEPLSTNIKHTTKLNEEEIWEVEMWRFSVTDEPFRKAILPITIHKASNRDYELRVRNRYANEDTAGPWLISDPDKVIGKTGKTSHLK